MHASGSFVPKFVCSLLPHAKAASGQQQQQRGLCWSRESFVCAQADCLSGWMGGGAGKPGKSSPQSRLWAAATERKPRSSESGQCQFNCLPHPPVGLSFRSSRSSARDGRSKHKHKPTQPQRLKINARETDSAAAAAAAARVACCLLPRPRPRLSCSRASPRRQTVRLRPK